jgi:hypothetical protein
MFNHWQPFQFRHCRSPNQPAPQAQTPPWLIQATPTLGTHAGLNAVGAALVTSS